MSISALANNLGFGLRSGNGFLGLLRAAATQGKSELPSRPKRPAPVAYLYFKDHMVNNEPYNVTKQAQLFEKLPDTTKRKYTKVYQSQLEAYANDIKEYQRVLKEKDLVGVAKAEKEAKESRLKRQIIKQSKAMPPTPKRPVGPFNYYVGDYMVKNKGIHLVKSIQHCSNLWKSMKPREKEKYQMMYTSRLQTYKEEMEAYNKANIQDIAKLTYLEERLKEVKALLKK